MNRKIFCGFALSFALWGVAIAGAGLAVSHAMDGVREVAVVTSSQG